MVSDTADLESPLGLDLANMVTWGTLFRLKHAMTGRYLVRGKQPASENASKVGRWLVGRTAHCLDQVTASGSDSSARVYEAATMLVERDVLDNSSSIDSVFMLMPLTSAHNTDGQPTARSPFVVVLTMLARS